MIMRVKISILMFFASLIILPSWGQSTIENNIVQQFNQDIKIDQQTLRLNFLFPGIEYEHRIFNNGSLVFNTNIGAEVMGADGPRFGVIHVTGLAFRYYYNLNRRYEKGKYIGENSLNFISLRPYYHLYSIARIEGNISYGVDLTWGMQRSFGKGFYYGGEVGLSYNFNRKNEYLGDTGFFPALKLKLGYTLFNKK